MRNDIINKNLELVYRNDINEYGGAIYCDLKCFNKIIGYCTLYIPNQNARDEGLSFYFDAVDPIAAIHYDKVIESDYSRKTFFDKQRFVYLTDMYVEPKYRNMGIGSSIITKIKEYLLFILEIEHLFLVSAIYKDNKNQSKVDNFYYKNKFKSATNEGLSGKLMYFHVTSDNMSL